MTLMPRSPGGPSRTGAPRAARIAVALAAIPLISCSGPAPGAAETRERGELVATVDSLVAAWRRETYAPGVSVAVVRGGRDTLVHRGYGVADVENGVPATPETVYPIASLTKTFTAAAVMLLAEEGRLSLDDPVGRHLPGLPAGWRAIPIRQLLNHTSGVPAHPVLLRDGAMTPDSVLALAGKEPAEFAPGTRWEYSNVGYLVLGRLIEKVSGEPYARYVETKLLRPLGLASTRYCGAEPMPGYVQRDTGVARAAGHNLRVVFAAGALCSTVGDLAAWSHALATGRVVRPESWVRMTTPEGASTGYGYGLIVMEFEGRRMVGHGGALEGFRASSAYLPGDSLSVTLLTNLGTESPDPLVLEIVRAALGGSRSGSAAARGAER